MTELLGNILGSLRLPPSRRGAPDLLFVYVRAAIIVIVSALGSGCFFIGDRGPVTMPAIVSQVGDDILFDLPSSVGRPRSTTFEAIVILRYPAPDRRSGGEERWRMQMDKRLFKEDPILEWPMRYGQNIANTVQIVRAKKLEPGHYHLDLVVILRDVDGQNGGIRNLISDFSINKNLKLER
jgi:hypothetical protein